MGVGLMWWLIVNTPDGVHCWPVGDTGHDVKVLAARMLVGCPNGTEVILDGSPWDVQLTYDRPHESLLARATVHTAEELDRADPAALSAYTAAEATEYRSEQMRAARAALDGLDPAAKEELFTAYGRAPAAAPTKGAR